MTNSMSLHKRVENEGKFLKRMVRRWKLDRRPAVWIPIKDSYFLGLDGQRYSQRRPFDGVLLHSKTAWAVEAKFVKGVTFNVAKWFKEQPHQPEALWRVHKTGNVGMLAIGFQSMRLGTRELIVEIQEIAEDRNGNLYPKVERVGPE